LVFLIVVTWKKDKEDENEILIAKNLHLLN